MRLPNYSWKALGRDAWEGLLVALGVALSLGAAAVVRYAAHGFFGS